MSWLLPKQADGCL